MNNDYKDVNDNKIEFIGQTNATVKTNTTTLQLLLLITKANITPLMGLDWMKRLKITTNSNTEAIKIHNKRTDQNEKRILKLKNEFKDLFYNNTEIKDTVVKINLKENANLIQQKGKPIPIYLQDQVAEELKRLTKKGYLERATEINEDCFVSLAVITVNKDKSIKIALDSSKLNEATIKRKAQMHILEELISKISRKISEEKEGEIHIAKLDFDYAYEQRRLDEQARNLCIWLDDIIIVTKGSAEKHEAEIKETMKKLEETGYRLNPKIVNFSEKKQSGLDTKKTKMEYDL